MIIYLDTSAALKLLIEEKESHVLAEYLTQAQEAGHTLVASMLMFTELHCAARRRARPPEPEAVNTVLSSVSLVDLERADLSFAAAMPGRLRSADAVHLATALRLGVDLLVACDVELLSAAKVAGLDVTGPAPTEGRGFPWTY